MLTAIGPLAAMAWQKLSAFFLAIVATPLGAGAVVAGLFLAWNAWIDNPRVREQAVAGCVSTVEVAALRAKMELEQQRREASERALAGYRRLAAEDAEAAEAHAAELEQENADYEKKLADTGRGCRLSADDVQRVLDNRKKLGGGR